MIAVPLADLVSPAGKKAGAETDLPVYSVTKHAGFVPSLEYFRKQVFSRDVGGYKLVEPGDFAYASIHLDEGSIGIAPERGLISPMYTVFKADDARVDPGYLIRFLKSPRALAHYPQLGKGAVHRRKAISLAALGTLSVPLPALAEQRRIAAILDHAEALRTKRRQVLTHLDALTQSIFTEMLGSSDWPLQRLDTLIDGDDRMNYGVVQPGDDTPEGVPLVRVSDLVGGIINRMNLKRISPDIEASYTRSRLRGTEILVSSVGSIGVVSLARPDDIGSNIARAITRIPISDETLRTYVYSYLRTPVPQHYFVAELRTVAQPTLNVGQLAATQIPVPPKELQAAFAHRLQRVQSTVDVVMRASRSDDELFTSLQCRAFRGEL